MTQDFHLYITIIEEIRLCHPLVAFPDLSNNLFLEHASIETFAEALKNRGKFDYIEYNGGVSLTDHYRRHLKIFQDLLSPEGIIGKNREVNLSSLLIFRLPQD